MPVPDFNTEVSVWYSHIRVVSAFYYVRLVYIGSVPSLDMQRDRNFAIRLIKSSERHKKALGETIKTRPCFQWLYWDFGFDSCNLSHQLCKAWLLLLRLAVSIGFKWDVIFEIVTKRYHSSLKENFIAQLYDL